MANYIMRVEFRDHFRVKLIHDEKKQTESVTDQITAYTISHCESGFALPYSLIIIDSPGFGDTAGIERDKKITKQVKTFFSMEKGITHLDGIGFVCQSSCVCLTPTQRYIFDSVFAMFGADVRNNIFILVTFCDDDFPQVINALKKVDIPAEKYFKFNSSALYSDSKRPSTESNWDMNVDSFRRLFSSLEDTKSVSLKMTKEVLEERDKLEAIMIGLQECINKGMNLINSLK